MSRRIAKGHVLDVAVACLKEDKRRNPVVIEELEKIAAEYKGRDRLFDRHKEQARINVQRALFAALPEFGPASVAADALKKAMIDRAWQLLDMGQHEACDALLEFVPQEDGQAMLDEYFKEEGEA